MLKKAHLHQPVAAVVVAVARGGMGGGNFVATQDANTLTSYNNQNRTGWYPNYQICTVYTLDGKENTLPAPAGGGGGGGGAASKYVATWSADGKTLTIVTTRTFNDTPMKTTEVWTLTDPKDSDYQSQQDLVVMVELNNN